MPKIPKIKISNNYASVKGPPIQLQPVDPKTIQENLRPLRSNKRMEAQQHYYRARFAANINKLPVRQRLGQNQNPESIKTSLIQQNGLKQQQSQRHNHITQTRKSQNFRLQRIKNDGKALIQNGRVQKKVVKLKSCPAKNFSVQIKNNLAESKNTINRFQIVLNPKIQSDIDEIQSSNASRNTYEAYDFERFTPIATDMTTNTRFTLISQQ